MNLSLSKTECNVLYKKKIKLGMSPFEAHDVIKKLKDYLHNFVLKLNKEGKSDIEIEKRFRLEWEKICQESEV